ncbi:MAG: hypothetical protein M3077_00970 [Candidatus Dormibacteraeota bacterium]|nr:hypothetical protein [Candidatus Dormibacteraeota bacterium]
MTVPPSYGSGLRTLVFLDAHIFINRLRSLRRDPKRAVMWGIFILWIIAFLPLRLMGGSRTSPLGPGIFKLFATIATFIPGLVLLIIAVVVAGSRRPFALFRSAADARFLCGSALPRRLVILWLDFRVIRTTLLQLPFFAFWVIVFPASLGVTLSRILGIGLVLALFGALILGLNLPLFVLRRTEPSLPLPLIAWAIAILGLGSLAIASNQAAHGIAIPSILADPLLGLPPGAWVVGAIRGDLLSLLAVAVTAAVALTLTAIVADDVYPELWQASTRVIALQGLMRRSGGLITPRQARDAMREAGVPQMPRRRATASSSRGTRVPGGNWTLLWKDWLAMRRMRGGLRWPLAGAIVAIALGWTIGGGFGRPPRAIAVGVAANVTYLWLIFNLMVALRLAVDLRNPLWWLSAASLRARLATMALGRGLRQIGPIAAGLLAATIASRSALVFALGLPLVTAMIWDLQAMGFATYSIIPTAADARGPGLLLRLLLLLLLLIPLAVTLAGAAVATHHVGVGLLATAAAALLEGWLLLLLATSRLEGNGLAFAQAESR